MSIHREVNQPHGTIRIDRKPGDIEICTSGYDGGCILKAAEINGQLTSWCTGLFRSALIGRAC